MTRLLSLVLPLVPCFVTPLVAAGLAGSRPNIVFVLTDDQGKGDLACHGHPFLRTPHLDRLYAQSTRFTDFHVSPTCSPTRSALMSGRHEFMNGVSHTMFERERLTLKATTVAEVLHRAGYATGIFGKWHLGDEEAYQPYRRGFDESFIHGAGGIGQKYDSSCADAPPNSETPRRYFDPVINHNGRFVQTKGYCTDLFFEAALGWIKARARDGNPFLAYITPNAPHFPHIAPAPARQRFIEMGFDVETATRWAMIENIDDNVGRLLARLTEWKLEEKTLVIFMTDNGQAGGSRRGERHGQPMSMDFSGFKSAKNSPHEGGTNVPSFWQWRGVLPEGRDVPRLAAHIDVFPTLVALAGAVLPGGNQVRGRNLLPLLENPDAPWADRHLFVHSGRWPKGAAIESFKFKSCAVRSARFRFVNNKELYDIAADPFEKHNVFERHPQVVAELRAAYDRWWTEALPLLVNEQVPDSPVRPYWERYDKQRAAGGIPVWTPPPL